MKLEKLEFSKFVPFKIENTFTLVGGTTPQQSGGASCATGAGSNSYGQSWTSDNDEYNANGVKTGGEYYGATGFLFAVDYTH
jgi:hypothetical protein